MGKSTSEVENATESDSKRNTDVKQREKKPNEVTLRAATAQILASSAKNLLLINMGMAIGFPTIVIPALLHSPTQPQFTDSQASWFGSVAFICQPLGSLASGMTLEWLGRKRAMLLVTLPHIAGWALMYTGYESGQLLAGAAVTGLAVGFMEAAIITYVGEIWYRHRGSKWEIQPELRGILTSMAGFSAVLGFLVIFFLGTVTDWRTAAAISLALPIATLIAIALIPETPMWLLSKGRNDQALKSLCWLRGWVPPDNAKVQKEFVHLLNYSEQSSKCHSCRKDPDAALQCAHKQVGLVEAGKRSAQNLMRRNTLKPLSLVIVYFAFYQLSGFPAIRPYLIPIFRIYGIPLDPNVATVAICTAGLLGSVGCMSLVRVFGKRGLSLISFCGCSLMCTSLGLYAHFMLDPGARSTTWGDKIKPAEDSWVPLALFITLALSTGVGISSICWTLLSEVFPYKTRGMASGIAAAASYVLAFGASKTYLDLERLLGIRGVFWLYGCCCFVGAIFVYYALPETEGKTYEQIEAYFAGVSTSRKIQPINTNVIALECIQNADVEVAKETDNVGNIKIRIDGVQNGGYVNDSSEK